METVYCATLRPTTPTRMHPRKSRRAGDAESPNRQMPRTAVPNAPIPVQTAYALPMGRLLTEADRSIMLNSSDRPVPTVGQKRVKPAEYLRPVAKRISKTPARTTKDQATTSTYVCERRTASKNHRKKILPAVLFYRQVYMAAKADKLERSRDKRRRGLPRHLRSVRIGQSAAIFCQVVTG